MSLVERFVEIGGWPTSRRTALWAGLLLTLHALGWAVTHFDVASAEGDPLLFDHFVAVWTGLVGLCLLVSLPPALSGKDAPWTAYAFIVLYASPVVAMTYLFSSAALLAYVPVVVLFVTVFFDERLGGTCLLYIVGALVAVTVLEGFQVLPYAHELLQPYGPNAVEFGMNSLMVLLLQTFIVIVALCVLTVSARRLQERRLRAAQQALQESTALLERSHRLIRRYVPAQLADQIQAGSHHEDSKPERRKLTIVFSDVEGFTSASDELDPEALAAALNEYLAEMTQIADRHGATVNQLVGDGIMIFFGAPTATTDEDHALRAVRMALQMQDRMGELRATWFRNGLQRPFQIRIGINTGYASVGDFGSPGRKLYSGIGIQTNLAARIQALCEPGKVLVSHTTWALVHEKMACVDRGEVEFEGLHYKVRVYEVMPEAAGPSA